MKIFIETQFKKVEQSGEIVRVPDLGGYMSKNVVRYSLYDKAQDGNTGCLVRVTSNPSTIDNILDLDITTKLTDDEVLSKSDNPFGGKNCGLESLDHPDIEVDKILNNYTIDEALTSDDKKVANIVFNWSGLDQDDKARILSSFSVKSLQELVEELPDSDLADLATTEEKFDGIPDNIDTATAARVVTQGACSGKHVLQDQELTALDKAASCEGCEYSDEVPSSSRGEEYNSMSKCARGVIDGCGDSHQQMLDYVKGDGLAPWK